MVPVSARVTELRLNENTVDCVLEKSRNYPSNWREGLDDIPDAVLAQFQRLVPRDQLPSADYVILCTGFELIFDATALITASSRRRQMRRNSS